MAVPQSRRLFTAEEYERMVEAGILHEDERVELLDGEIVAMSPISPRHLWTVNRLARMFGPIAERAVLSVQNPVRVDDRAIPEPDLALLRPGTPQDRLPGPADVLLIVEVALTSTVLDRETKAPMYARGAIPEMWIADLIADRIEVRLEPSPSGYKLIRIYTRGERLSPQFAPDFVLDVDAILGTADPYE